MIQFETKVAIENVDDILSVPGIDSVITGPCDLSMSLGIDGDLENQILKNSVKKVFDSCRYAERYVKDKIEKIYY